MPSNRDRTLAIAAAMSATLLLAFLAFRGLLREMPGTNSFGALADAFLHGRLYVDKCPEIDCAVFKGRTYIIFPPLPALLAMPFVAFVSFQKLKGFIFMGAALVALALFFWSRICAALGVARTTTAWLLVALAFASPAYQVALRSDGVWFFAQAVGFLMMTLSLWAVLCRRSLVLAGLFVALAFLCRQMAIFYPLFLILLAMDPEERFFAGVRRLIRPVLVAGVFVLAALALVFVYNAARFGSPLDTGYAYMSNPGNTDFIWRRIKDLGIFSRDYAVFNLLYLFVQGIHFEFTGPHLTRIGGLDKNGVALLVASPWLLLAAYSRLDRVFVAGVTTILIIAGIALFYHSNGADQFNTQRYALDWLPILVVLMLRGASAPAFAALPVLVTWGVATNAIVVVLAALLRL